MKLMKSLKFIHRQISPKNAFALWVAANLILTTVVVFTGILLAINGIISNYWTIILSVLIISIFEYFLYRMLILKPFRVLEYTARELRHRMADLNITDKSPYMKDDYTVLLHIGDILNTMRVTVDKEYEAEILRRQAQFSALQSQINPHFLYNTLDSIRGQALADGSEEIAEMIEALSSFFRYNISQKGDFVTLREELKNIENYFFIQRCRFNNRFEMSIKIEDERALDYLLPKLTIQPIVENSVYHGLESKIGKGLITIDVILTERRLIITISDNGVGMDRATLRDLNVRLNSDQSLKINKEKNTEGRHSGIAVTNVNARIKLLFGSSYGLRISSTLACGVETEITLPLITPETIPAESEAIIHETRIDAP